MPPPGGTLENFYMGAQLHYFQCAMASNVDLKVKCYAGFGAYKLTTSSQIVNF